MCCENHAAGTVCCSISGIRRYIIEKLGYLHKFVLCCGCLLNSNGVKREKEFVVYSLCIVEECTGDALSFFYAFSTKLGAGVYFIVGILLLSTILDQS